MFVCLLDRSDEDILDVIKRWIEGDDVPGSRRTAQPRPSGIRRLRPGEILGT